MLRKSSSREVPGPEYLEALWSLPVQVFQYSRLAGLRTKDGVRRILSENGIALAEREIDSIAAAKSKIALERTVRENLGVQGAGAVLTDLSRRCKLALANSGSAASVNAFLERNGIRSFFEYRRRCVWNSGDMRFGADIIIDTLDDLLK